MGDGVGLHGDLPENLEIGKGEDSRAFVAAVGDVQPVALAVRAQREELFGRRNLGGVEHDAEPDGAAFGVDGDHALRLRQTDVDRAAASYSQTGTLAVRD